MSVDANSLVTFRGAQISYQEFQTKETNNLIDRNGEIAEDPSVLYRQVASPSYKRTYPIGKRILGFAAAALSISALAIYILFVSGHLLSLPQDIVHLASHLNLTHLAVGGGITTVLLVGASIVIHRSRTNADPLLHAEDSTLNKSTPNRGSFAFIEDHIESGVIHYRNNHDAVTCIDVLVDKSSLVNGEGSALIYYSKPCADHYTISTIAPLVGMPLAMIGSIAYNLIRTCVIPFYILVQLMRESCSGKEIYPGQRFFSIKDIPIEMGLSLWRVVKAPFYATAMVMAAAWSLINPVGGRKLGSCIERDWNEDVPLSQGFWSVNGRMTQFEWEGGGGPQRLGKNGFYLFGCWQAIGRIHYDLSSIRVESMEKIMEPNNPKWNPWNYKPLDGLAEGFSQETYKQLMAERDLISVELARRNRN